jgi:uncharacterized protein (DUF433 family)
MKNYIMNYGAINIDPETMGGTPVFTGTRVPIQSLFDYIETGETLDEFLDNFPSVKKDFAIQVLEMASKTLTSEKILNENFAWWNFGKNFEIHTVKDMGWLGKKNGELLGLATFNGFDIFLTLDKNLKNQQSINKFDLKFIVLLAVDNKHQTLQPYIERVKILLNNPPILKISEISLA